ncbi:DUF6931 family protein [Phreatobacter stygius]|uniref:Uncharacterized protein n=1 Tax=Phreatobacter stygius TaxID=1940610 RepID=A0A4D7AW06_9HYPH|nr:hypothetical protein [Phreatobacter stygius]QCI64051.1 hypothetical protein E8M01_07195 [Phreatobacter stygius]
MGKLRFATARDVFEAFPTLADDMLASPSEREPLAFLAELAAGPTPEDAVSFCAYVLPRRDAVWWACRCTRSLTRPQEPVEDQALAAAEAWVREPNEESRTAAMSVGNAANRTVPTTWAALAAAWSGGNLSLGEHPGAPAPPHLTAKAARACVLMALARVPATERRAKLRACIEGGIRLAAAEAT